MLRPMPADVHVVADADEAARHVGRWRELAEATPASLFVSPEWYFAWLAVAGGSVEPRLFLAEEGGRLVGVLPLVRERRWPRALRFAGDVSADRTAVPAASDDVRRALLASALRFAEPMLVLTHADGDAGRLLPHGARVVNGQEHRLPFADLDGGWDAYLVRRTANFRADLKRKRRSLQSAHDVEWRRTATAAELDDDLGTFFRLHDDRWTNRGGSTSSSQSARHFLREVARRALATGVLRLWQLRADDRPVASFFGWSFGDSYAYYLAGFDAAFARHSPGTLLLAHTIREACDEGRRRYDLLLGDETYKARFADGAATVRSLVVGRRAVNAPFLLAAGEANARALLRRLPARPRAVVQRAAVRVGSRLPLTRTR
jgi:CelD/BcsL family acetyltransferase involved in cellulose biosynthesis